MTTPDVNTIIATSSSAINWVTDVIVPLTSALIGGLLALWGVHITLNHDTSDRARTQDELARPFFTILDAGDSRQNATSLCIFDFSTLSSDGECQDCIYMLNSDKVEFIIEKVTVSGHDFLPGRKELISKGLPFMLLLSDRSPLDYSNTFLHIIDINHKNRTYKLLSQNNIPKEWIEVQKEV